MCLALVAINEHPKYPLIILSNRDEFYARPTLPANFWQNNLNVFAGKDLKEGGTWLGVTRSGYFALLTNYRDPKLYKSSLESRGRLVSNYLFTCETTSPLQYLQRVQSFANKYNKFNLIIGSINQILYYSNVQNSIQELSSGIYSLSNHLLNTPWPKTEKAKALLKKHITELDKYTNNEEKIDVLYTILSEESLAPDNQLPVTGIARDLEKSLSSVFVHVPQAEYGTVNSTIILFQQDSSILFSEKIFQQGNFISSKLTLF
ncbi:NRDE family protein [Legionella gresilensis]|uniref:NRDE family protein n=1 Tax=Legionella gresilensis TaxID=91823 RepID=UPI0010410EF1|nr:NRDE family protein [Legionella gresilensis]